MRETPPDPAEIDWGDTGLVSVFVRDRIGEPPSLANGTVRSEVQLVEGEWDGSESGFVSRFGATSGVAGWLNRVGGDVDAAALYGFEAAYSETMARTGAGERYLFSTEYSGDPPQQAVLAPAGKP